MKEEILPTTLIKCPKCNINLMEVKEGSFGEVVQITFNCDCGGKAIETFAGTPYIGGTPDCYFDFISEKEFACHKRK